MSKDELIEENKRLKEKINNAIEYLEIIANQKTQITDVENIKYGEWVDLEVVSVEEVKKAIDILKEEGWNECKRDV